MIDARIRRQTGHLVPLPPAPWSERVPETADLERQRFLTDLAAAMNWPCPLGLDEPDPETGDLGMDAPGYRPYCGWRPATGRGPAPDFNPSTRPMRTRPGYLKRPALAQKRPGISPRHIF